MENHYQKHGLASRTYSIKSLIMASTFGSKSKFFITMSIPSQDEPLTNRPVAIALPQDVPSTSNRHLIVLENQVQRLMEAHLAPTQPTQVNKITTSCEICSAPRDTQYCMEDPEQAFVEYASSRTDEAGGISILHKAYWAIKNCNMDLTKAGANRFLQINELDEMRLDAYESFISYKERIKRWHDKRIKAPTNYERGDKVIFDEKKLGSS
ncbi:hypothetical protein Tco_0211052 [Tanacetum coccineum]